MPIDDPRDETEKRGEPEIAAAELLFRDQPVGSKPAASVTGASAPVAAGETFELADAPDDEAGASDPPVAPIPTVDRPAPRARESARPTPRARESYPIEPEAAVDEVWSRGAEWGPNLVVVGGWLAGLGLVLYFLMGWEWYWLAFLVLMLGGLGAMVLSYPIFITLERPVRMTPEQALKDFYGALSHHLPHYRRMWLLLARSGRLSSSFGSFEGFKAYWDEKLQTIKGSRAGRWTPLVFEVEGYRGDKSAGKSQVEVKFTLKIYIRGKRQDGPIASIPGQVSMARGPDKMWYLESGTLPHSQRESRST